jgi:hypothetical protein
MSARSEAGAYGGHGLGEIAEGTAKGVSLSLFLVFCLSIQWFALVWLPIATPLV